MLAIYDKTTTSFNNLGIGVLKDFKSDPLITEVLNGLYNLEFEYACDGWLSDYLVEENIIKANGQPFRIWNIKKNVDKHTITILARHIFFDAEKTVWLEDVAPTSLTAQLALEWCINRAKDSSLYTSSGDCTKLASARYVRTNLIDAVYNNDNAILKQFGGEIELNNYNVILHNRRGNELGLEIRQKKNLQGADYELDFSKVATRIMPVGNDGLLLPEKYINSPIIGNYFSPLYYKYECNVGINEEEGITEEIAYQMMRDEVSKLFKNGVDKPSINIKINFIELSKTLEYAQYSSLETAHLGDSCKVYIPSLNLSLTTRIVKTVYNCLKKRIVSLELGSVKPNLATSRIKDDRDVKNALSNDNDTSILHKAKDQATSMINHPFAGHLYIDEETGELYIMDTTSPNSAHKVWKWGLGGLGFSPTGINGPYGLAMTMDGAIVADYITAGKLNTNVINGYDSLVLQVGTNKSNISSNSTRISQTAKSIELSVNNGSTSSGITIKTTKEDGTTETTDGTIQMNGLVSFNNLSTSGQTTINGNNITTGVIKSSNYVANSSGTKIDLSNGSIDSKNFKVNSSGNVSMTGASINNGTIEVTDNDGHKIKLGQGYYGMKVATQDDTSYSTIQPSTLLTRSSSLNLETTIGPNGVYIHDLSNKSKLQFGVLNPGASDSSGYFSLSSSNGAATLEAYGSSGNIYQNGVNIFDAGSSGIWSYMKFSNGFAVCFARESKTISVSNNFGNLKTSASQTIDDFPFSFTSIPTVSRWIDGANSGIAMNSGNVAASVSNAGGYQVARGTAITNGSFIINTIAIGFWK